MNELDFSYNQTIVVMSEELKNIFALLQFLCIICVAHFLLTWFAILYTFIHGNDIILRATDFIINYIQTQVRAFRVVCTVCRREHRQNTR